MIVKPWPNGLASRPQVNASLQNQNLRTDLRWVGKRIRKSARKFTQDEKGRKFPHIHLTCDQLVSTCVGWPNGENLRRLAYEFDLDQCQRKSSQVITSHRKQRKWVAKRNGSWTQVENLRRLTSPFGQGFTVAKQRTPQDIYENTKPAWA